MILTTRNYNLNSRRTGIVNNVWASLAKQRKYLINKYLTFFQKWWLLWCSYSFAPSVPY